MRFVLVHNHIFKNAGSTVDHLFERAGFVNTRMEATGAFDAVTGRMILEAVERNPAIEYISSHVLREPRPPDTDQIGFVDITFIRHPIDRLYSIYRYFRQPGVRDFPMIDKGVSFASFVDALEGVAPSHLHSPQTTCLGNRRDFYFPPHRETLERAKGAVMETRFLGVVDHFETSFQVFVRCCSALMPGKDLAVLAGPFPKVNSSAGGEGALEANLAHIRSELGEERFSRIVRCNQLDLELHGAARDELFRRQSLVAAHG